MKRIIIGVSGASGALFAQKVLEILCGEKNVESHLIISKAARLTIALELDIDVNELSLLADRSYAEENIAAGPASGSFCTDGMIIAPCSVHTLSAIAHGQASNLLIRAADVTLKERRPLVLMVRETPLHAGHIKAMLAATQMGAIIAPPVPALYAKPGSIEDMAGQTAARALEPLGISSTIIKRWK
ncbi:MAG: UbiX family flavin prenyltransferase [bacterium]|nr:UbiX family flavin prenyltransferase [bacterium]